MQLPLGSLEEGGLGAPARANAQVHHAAPAVVVLLHALLAAAALVAPLKDLAALPRRLDDGVLGAAALVDHLDGPAAGAGVLLLVDGRRAARALAAADLHGGGLGAWRAGGRAARVHAVLFCLGGGRRLGGGGLGRVSHFCFFSNHNSSDNKV